MIYLLGCSGYIGNAYKRLLESNGIPFRSLARSEVDYTNIGTLTAALREDKPEFLINVAGYTGKPNVDACEMHKSECLAGNSVLPGSSPKPARMQTCPGVTYPQAAFIRVVDRMARGSRKRTPRISASGRITVHSTAGPKRWARRRWPTIQTFTFGACAFRSTNSNTPQLSHQVNALSAPSKCNQFHLGVAGVRRGQLALLANARPLWDL
jgi:dTDP-6-deoxy-L-lyxo-4-hexulose reductase RmlD-like protein